VKVRLVQLDGSLPNLAIMKLARWHLDNGDTIHVTRRILPDLFEPQYDRVYGSAIFKFSQNRIALFRQQWPDGILGGTGTGLATTVEQVIGQRYEFYDYSGYQDFTPSIGFTQRGCRLACKFCLVREKEGGPQSVNSIYDIWRGEPWPKKIHILDNDFFGVPQWRDRIREIREGKFRLCLSQGINVRMITEEAAAALASIEYRDTRFRKRKLYTAWDNLGDEARFYAGVRKLEAAGIPATHLRAYMLMGFDPKETWQRIWYRFRRMVDWGIEPYPMVYDRTRADLLCFQRWVVRGLYRTIPWPEYKRQTKTEESLRGWQQVYEEHPAKLARAIAEARDRIWAREPDKHIELQELLAELREEELALPSEDGVP
jgi:hypothetical protein